jgi:predicted transcriptional regulator
MVRGVISYRNRTDIVTQILEIANEGGLTKYQIGYRAFLNYGYLKEILTMLIENSLLSYDQTMRTFTTTAKGLTFLQAYNQMDEMLKEQQV